MRRRFRKTSVRPCLAFAAALVLCLGGCRKPETAATPAAPVSIVAEPEIQARAKVVEIGDPNGSTSVGIMAAYEPNSRSFWWRPTPMIAEPSMLESYYERCKFVMDGRRVVNFCVRGNEVVSTTAKDYADSMEAGFDQAEKQLREDPGLMMGYRSPGDRSFDLKVMASVDMNTPQGVPPTSVRSVTRTPSGFTLDVTCGCGDALITLDQGYAFKQFQKR